MEWKKKKEVYAILLFIKLVFGVTVKTQFSKTFGDGMVNGACTMDAGNRDYLATMINASNTCTSLGWDWASALSFDTGSTYFEKKHVVEVYDIPMVLGGAMRLPVRFCVGAYIDMRIEFTADDFAYGHIQLLDTLDDAYDVYTGTAETLMISLEMRPQSDNLMFKTYAGSWTNHADISPYPLPAGSMHNITFKAMTNDIQVLLDDVEVEKYTHPTQPENAKMLLFSDVGMLLHRIEFVAP